LCCELGFPIFRKVMITLDLVESQHNSIRLLNNSALKPRNRSTMTPLVIDQRCMVDLTKKAKSLPTN
jgi:hypothetical protein